VNRMRLTERRRELIAERDSHAATQCDVSGNLATGHVTFLPYPQVSDLRFIKTHQHFVDLHSR